ncbi:MAG: aspartate aminotransferase family protein [Chloroflexota bacterium]
MNKPTNVLPKVAYGKGSWVYDQDGKEYFDGSGGPAVFCLGHGDERVNTAIQTQLGKIAQGYRGQFTSDPLDELTALVSRRLHEDDPPDSHQNSSSLSNMFFLSSGSEAVETCLKIALQYQQAIGETSRTRFIARERSYHGNTLGALSVSGHPKRRSFFENSLLPVSFVSAANAYRPPEDITPEEMPAFAAAELEAEILRLGPENVCAFIFEPVVGAAGCVVPAPDGYAQAMQAVCQKYGVLVIADEVMCGSGRIGPWRASAHDGIVPDLMTVAKGLGGGYIPLAASVYQDYISDAIVDAHDMPMTGHTFMGHTLACASALAVQQIIETENLTDRVTELGPWLGQSLQNALGDHPHVGNIRGRGFFWGIELVADRETKQPFAPEKQVVVQAEQALREAGVLLYPVSAFVDAIHGDGLVVAPAYNASHEELTEMVERISSALYRCF